MLSSKNTNLTSVLNTDVETHISPYIPSNMEIIFDIGNKEISTKFKGTLIRKKIMLSSPDKFKWNKFAYFTYPLDNKNEITSEYKWVISWNEWANHEQFLKFEEYKKPKITEKGLNPWTLMAQWSHISNPQKGTIQTNKVYRIIYLPHLFPDINLIKISIVNNPNGDWDTIDSKPGYYY